jgi:hypothetical protein
MSHARHFAITAIGIVLAVSPFAQSSAAPRITDLLPGPEKTAAGLSKLSPERAARSTIGFERGNFHLLRNRP